MDKENPSLGHSALAASNTCEIEGNFDAMMGVAEDIRMMDIICVVQRAKEKMDDMERMKKCVFLLYSLIEI